jgi:hypothetical protein
VRLRFAKKVGPHPVASFFVPKGQERGILALAELEKAQSPAEGAIRSKKNLQAAFRSI